MTGKDVRRIRLKLGYNQTEFGTKLGYRRPQIQVSRIENSKKPIQARLANLIRMMEEKWKRENLE